MYTYCVVLDAKVWPYLCRAYQAADFCFRGEEYVTHEAPGGITKRRRVNYVIHATERT